MPVLYSRTGALERSSTYDFDGDTERYSRGSEILEQRVSIPDYADRLPKEIAMFEKSTVYNAKTPIFPLRRRRAWGSHPHLVHEFVRSIIENRKPTVDISLGAYWTGTGICAHISTWRGKKS